jgi:hypothetical protein
LLSNVVLDELDSELDRRGHRFVRYADDAKVYVRSERAGQRVMASLTEFIEGRLRLKVNEAKSAVARPEDRHFLGFRLRVDPQSGTVEVLLSERTKRNAMQKVKQLTPRTWGSTLIACISGLNAWLRGVERHAWWLRRGNSASRGVRTRVAVGRRDRQDGGDPVD